MKGWSPYFEEVDGGWYPCLGTKQTPRQSTCPGRCTFESNPSPRAALQAQQAIAYFLGHTHPCINTNHPQKKPCNSEPSSSGYQRKGVPAVAHGPHVAPSHPRTTLFDAPAAPVPAPTFYRSCISSSEAFYMMNFHLNHGQQGKFKK